MRSDYLSGLRDFLDLANWNPADHPRNPANGRFIDKGALLGALGRKLSRQFTQGEVDPELLRHAPVGTEIGYVKPSTGAPLKKFDNGLWGFADNTEGSLDDREVWAYATTNPTRRAYEIAQSPQEGDEIWPTVGARTGKQSLDIGAGPFRFEDGMWRNEATGLTYPEGMVRGSNFWHRAEVRRVGDGPWANETVENERRVTEVVRDPSPGDQVIFQTGGNPYTYTEEGWTHPGLDQPVPANMEGNAVGYLSHVNLSGRWSAQNMWARRKGQDWPEAKTKAERETAARREAYAAAYKAAANPRHGMVLDLLMGPRQSTYKYDAGIEKWLDRSGRPVGDLKGNLDRLTGRTRNVPPDQFGSTISNPGRSISEDPGDLFPKTPAASAFVSMLNDPGEFDGFRAHPSISTLDAAEWRFVDGKWRNRGTHAVRTPGEMRALFKQDSGDYTIGEQQVRLPGRYGQVNGGYPMDPSDSPDLRAFMSTVEKRDMAHALRELNDEPADLRDFNVTEMGNEIVVNDPQTGDEIAVLRWYDWGEIAWIHVEPGMRRKGIGSAMVQRANESMDVYHSENLSDYGRAFAAATHEFLPEGHSLAEFAVGLRDFLDLANWNPADHPRNPANGRFISKGGALGSALERAAESLFGKISDPKKGDRIKFSTLHGIFDMTSNGTHWSGTKRSSEHGPSFPVAFPHSSMKDLFETGLFTPPEGMEDTKAFKRFLGQDPEKFVSLRPVDTKWTQVAPEDAYPGRTDYQYLAYKAKPLLFKGPEGDVVSIEGWGKFSDEEISSFVEATDNARNWGANVSPRLRAKPVEVRVPEVWDDDASVKAYVMPTLSGDTVNVNPDVLSNREREKKVLRALANREYFTAGGRSVDHPAEYHVLHEFGHLDDVRGEKVADIKGHTLNQKTPEEAFWKSHGRTTHYGASSSAEGYAEHFALWALMQRGDVNWIQGHKAHPSSTAAAAYAARYGWEGSL